MIFFLLFSCKEKENILGSNKQEILAKKIISENEIETYLQTKYEFLNAVNDSVKNALIFEISYHFYKNDDSLKFREWNKYSYTNSLDQKNISGIAESHWDLGNFFYRENIIDSSFYHFNLAYEQYLVAENELKAGRMLLNMAILQEKIKDYIGSENTTFRALDLIEGSSDSEKYTYSANNNLGIIYNGLKDSSQALEYHNIALSIAESLQDPIRSARSLNNIGVVYQQLHEYNSAIANYSKASQIDSIIFKDVNLYAMLTDNLGYSEFKLGNFQSALFYLLKALKIRDSIQHKSGIVINKLHLGEYYLESGDTTQALEYTKDANSLAAETHNNRDLLASYQLLSQVEPHNAQKYLHSYINLNDSLFQEERTIRNRFARIKFETDKFIKRADSLNQQKSYLTIGIVLVLILFVLTYIIQRQNSRNKKLVLKKQQQDSNEKIYDLLLRSQQKYEEGSSSERNRISRDLHDSVLSKFFGIRLNLEVLNNKLDKESEKKRFQYLESLKIVENEIRNISHKLNVDYDFSKIGFLDILKDLLYQMEEENFHINIVASPIINWGEIRNGIKINFYRIIQESLQNIRKHAEATRVDIIIKFENNYLILNIKDNGKGFDVSNKSKGIGLKNIQERVSEIQGAFEIVSDQNGTVSQIRIPKEKI